MEKEKLQKIHSELADIKQENQKLLEKNELLEEKSDKNENLVKTLQT